MEMNDNIQDELQTLSPLLAGIKEINVFKTPVGYFNQLSDAVFNAINSTGNITDTTTGNSSLTVPNGYFDDLANNIIQKIKTQQPATTNETGDGFSVLLNNLSKENVFEIPVNYFDSLSADVLSKINALENNTDELQHISPLLYSLHKENLGEIPAGYFDNLSAIILKKMANKTPGKVVTKAGRLSFIKYAVAAIFIGVISTIAFNYYNKPANIITNEFAALDSSIEKGKAMNETKFNETLNNLSQDDIIKYLQKTGTEADVNLLSSSINENIVPSQEEYLLNDKTLDNFITDVEAQQLNN
jgi:hypothetical protein